MFFSLLFVAISSPYYLAIVLAGYTELLPAPSYFDNDRVSDK